SSFSNSRKIREPKRRACFDNFGRVGRPASRRGSRSFSWRCKRDVVGRRRLVRRRALRIEQNPQRPLYVFTLTGEELLQMADISRVRRSNAGQLLGYQRAAVRRHIRNIAEYLDGPDVLLPNSLILALTPHVRFSGMRGPRGGDNYASVGT